MFHEFKRYASWVTRLAALFLVTISLLAFLPGTARPVHAAGWVVNTLTDAANGSCATTCTLRDAMTLAASGDAITFSVSGTITLSSMLPSVTKTLTMDGTGQSVTINGNNAVKIMVINGGGVVNLNALILSNGRDDDQGGGAISSNDGGMLNVVNSTFSANSGMTGGAINNFGGTVNIANSTFLANHAVFGGGAVGNFGGTVNIANSTFSANSVNAGGSAIVNAWSGTLNVTNSTFSANAEQTSGGAIANGGGYAGGTVTLTSSILANNSGGDCQNGGTFNGANNLSDNSCPGRIGITTGMSPTLANNGGLTQTFALLRRSNAINAVPNGACVYISSGTNPLFSNGAAISTDQRGISRPQGTLCDIGSYEAVGSGVLDTIGIFRSGTFYLRLHNSTGFADITVAFNPATKPYPVVGDWTGSGYDTVGVYDQSNGLFTLCTANNTTSCADAANRIQFVLGILNDQPIAGRWNATFSHFGGGVFRPSNGLIYLKNALTTGFADYTMVLGIPGDVGLAGDWNGDGLDSLGVYRPSNSTFYLNDQTCNCSLFGTYQFAYGIGGDAPVVGDWVGQGHDGVGLFRQTNGYTYLRKALTTGFADLTFVYGIAGDVPVAGHWQVNYPPVPNPGSVIVPPTVAPAPTSNTLATGLSD